MTADAPTGTAPVLRVTDAASAVVAEARSGESSPEELALFLEVNGVSDGAYTYDMWFQASGDIAPDDAVSRAGDLSVVVLASSVDKVSGATLDAGPDGLFIVNPNTPPRPVSALVASDLTDPLEIAVLEILEQEVNPQIASHGGRADLVAVDEGIAYLRLSGGCQGCGLAEVTLSQGIKVAIQEALPEIVDVVDVTDHEEGANPYFQPAKK